jgi:hypothetical protein
MPCKDSFLSLLNAATSCFLSGCSQSLRKQERERVQVEIKKQGRETREYVCICMFWIDYAHEETSKIHISLLSSIKHFVKRKGI